MDSSKWQPFKPSLSENGSALPILLRFASAFAVVSESETGEERNPAAERLRRCALAATADCKGAERQPLIAAIHVLADLVKQRWSVRVADATIEIARPETDGDEGLRERVRGQLHAERDEQLRQPAVREFVLGMQKRRLFVDQFVSVYSLMRDGPELAGRLRAAQALPTDAERLKELASVIRPYLQFVSEEDRCRLTGLRLVDVWRYFRHTWASPYKSVPGRTIMVLVRDAGAPFHPVIGIAALSSAAVALTVRDEKIGWTAEHVLRLMGERPTAQLAVWLHNAVDEAIREIYTTDLLRLELLSLEVLQRPTAKTVKALEAEGKAKRKQHYRMMEAREYKQGPPPEKMTEADWVARAEWPLFLSKRCQELALLLKVRMTLQKVFDGQPTREGLKRLIQTGEGRDAVTRVVRKVKAERVGTVIADLTVCGAVPPYNEVLGGKLVAMLMTSPEMVAEYRRRYGNVPSVIASSMAGRPVVRPADLVFIGTTALYAQRPTQYDRISIPIDPEGRAGEQAVRYEYLGQTRGVGTFQFGDKTVEALSRLLANSRRGQRVNSVFGEGVNPRLRKIRDGLNTLGLSSDDLLQHGAPRLVYGVELAENVGEYLLGMEAKPRYYFPLKNAASTTQHILAWWGRRWLLPRLARQETLDRVSQHRLTYPVTHGARVPLPRHDVDQLEFFGD
jgi:hypothetical protein